MPRNNNVYALPSGYLAVTGETIEAVQHNSPLEDLAADANNARPITAGGTGASNAADARTNLGAAAATHAVPQGAILMWSGSIASIPNGWALCDGTNGTPNLLGRFIVGAGQSYDPGDVGGENTVTLSESEIPAHTHTVTGTAASGGAHQHEMLHTQADASWGNTGANGARFIATAAGSTPYSQTGPSGVHSHSVTGTAASTGGGLAHENRPPFWALAYIMKL